MMIYDSPEEKDETCHICGKNKANAFWRCDQPIFVCRNCAVEELPQLIADAIVDGVNTFPKNKPTNDMTRIETIQSRFHSGFSSALIRKFVPEGHR